MVSPSRVSEFVYRQLRPQYRWGMVLIVLGISLVAAPPAYADPHALFYTTIGQQQLFFNVLAALDQADYVEPAQFRDALAQQRNRVIEEGSPQDGGIGEDPVVTETRTDLSGVLTRPITLEGDDQFTAQIANNYAIEVARRAAVTDLVTRVFCHRSLGREGCENTPDEIAKRDFGFVTNPIEWEANTFTQGALGALLSGTPEDQAERQQIIDDYTNKEGFQIGRVFNPFVAALHKETGKISGAKKLLEQAVANTALSMIPGLVNPETFSNLSVDENGRVDLANRPQGGRFTRSATNTALAATGDDYSTMYTQKLSEILALPRSLRAAAQAGSQNIQTIASTIEDQGEVADIKLPSRAECPEDVCPQAPQLTNILPTIEVPTAGKIAQLYALANILGILDSTITYASPDTLATPAGRVNLIQPPPLTPEQELQQIDQNLPQQPIDLSQPLVRNTTPAAGEVAGVINSADSITDFGAAPPVGVNPVIPHREAELAHVIEALYPGFYGGQPCGCGLETIANDYGTAILAKINSF